jgi:protein ImuB
VLKTIQLSRPTRDESNLFNLLRCALETVKTGVGFRAIRLAVPLTQRIADEQICLLGGQQHDANKELDQLVERLRVRLGEEGLVQPRLVESHLPEKAFGLAEPAGARESGWGRQECLPHRKKKLVNAAASWSELQKIRTPPAQPRPLHLLQTPVEVRVMVSPSDDREGRPISFSHGGSVRPLTRATGPERIAGCWWDGHNKTRDYFDAEDPAGRRFWIFRVMQTGKWYLHGEW